MEVPQNRGTPKSSIPGGIFHSAATILGYPHFLGSIVPLEP